MDALDLFLFMNDNGIELRWDTPGGPSVLSCWVPSDKLRELCQIASEYFENGEVDAYVRPGGVVWLDLVPLCEFYEIEPERIELNLRT